MKNWYDCLHVPSGIVSLDSYNSSNEMSHFILNWLSLSFNDLNYTICTNLRVTSYINTQCLYYLLFYMYKKVEKFDLV